MYLLPTCPSPGGPSITFQDDGVSTASTGLSVLSRRAITLSKGCRTGGLKEKPKSASTIRSVEERDDSKSEVNGMWMALSCLVRRLKRSAFMGFG